MLPPDAQETSAAPRRPPRTRTPRRALFRAVQQRVHLEAHHRVELAHPFSRPVREAVARVEAQRVLEDGPLGVPRVREEDAPRERVRHVGAAPVVAQPEAVPEPGEEVPAPGELHAHGGRELAELGLGPERLGRAGAEAARRVPGPGLGDAAEDAEGLRLDVLHEGVLVHHLRRGRRGM